MRVEIRSRGTKRFIAKNKELINYTRGRFAPEVVKKYLLFAKRIAPRDTGALVSAIKGDVKKQSGKLILMQPNHRSDGRNKPYHLWMHGIRAPSQGGPGYDISVGPFAPKTGQYGPKFMFVTFERMRKDSTEMFKKKVKTIY